MSEGDWFGSASVLDEEWTGLGEPRSLAVARTPNLTTRKMFAKRVISRVPADIGTSAEYRIGVLGMSADYADCMVDAQRFFACEPAAVYGTAYGMRVGSAGLQYLSRYRENTSAVMFHFGGHGAEWGRSPAPSISPSLVKSVAEQLQIALGASRVRTESVADEDVDSDDNAIGAYAGRERVVLYAIVSVNDGQALDRLIAFTSTPEWMRIVETTDSGIIVDIERE